ncbi:MAG TPA: EamA family transporter [Acidimicrobiales bacterium]|nr:EamA family transporter [Acidimicrobiales bacterium]
MLGGVGVQRSSQKGAAISMAAAANITSAVFLTIFVLANPPEYVKLSDVLWPALAGLLMAATRPLLYEGMARGPITVFAPGFGLTMIAVPALIGPFIGESLSALEVFGVLFAFPAVVFLSSHSGLPKLNEILRSRVIGLSLIVGINIGLAGIFISQANPEAGQIPVLVILGMGVVILTPIARIRSGSFWPDIEIRKFGFVLGCTSGIAFILSTAAYMRGSVAVITALIALCPGVSVIVAWKFLKEEISTLQIIGGIFGAASVVFFSLGA